MLLLLVCPEPTNLYPANQWASPFKHKTWSTSLQNNLISFAPPGAAVIYKQSLLQLERFRVKLHRLYYIPAPSVRFSSVAQSCLTLCDPMNRNTPGLPVHHQLLEFTQTHVHRVCDAIPFSSCPQSLPASESFPMSQLFP